jgi:hypothetical protein
VRGLPPRAARRPRARRGRSAVRATVTVADAAGNRGTARRTLTLRAR